MQERETEREENEDGFMVLDGWLVGWLQRCNVGWWAVAGAGAWMRSK